MLRGAAAAGLGAAFLAGRERPVQAATQNRHLVWVWQFSTDGEPNVIGARLRDHGLGILLKTHDGVTWMSEYDKSPYAVSGPSQAAVLANYFESAGVPFHAWAVIQGVDPVREAQMAAEVLAAGARSLYLDVEPHSGFWRGTPADAIRFGAELRRLSPDATLVLSIDARPWLLDRAPIREFASFSNLLAPQQYWRTFNTPANYEKFAASGFPVPPEGITPDFLVNIANSLLTGFGLPLHHVGQGATPDLGEWLRFIDTAYAAGGQFVSAWRYGVTPAEVLRLLRDIPPKQPPAPVAAGVYVVQPGDTLGAIAASFGVSVGAIAEANGLADPNYIYVGQQLTIPGASGGGAVAFSGGGAAQALTVGGGGQTYTVQPGDTLFGIAGRFGTTVDAIAQANGIADPSFILAGQQLVIP
ncbi:MAG TPA: LysM peptidoglycan-binding domain-containing protein [Dehalococcoidia bacterium]|nr:LysM peptidoglycan-binding domain-containing protein [Dehalococcoidia bacterium]